MEKVREYLAEFDSKSDSELAAELSTLEQMLSKKIKSKYKTQRIGDNDFKITLELYLKVLIKTSANLTTKNKEYSYLMATLHLIVNFNAKHKHIRELIGICKLLINVMRDVEFDQKMETEAIIQISVYMLLPSMPPRIKDIQRKLARAFHQRTGLRIPRKTKPSINFFQMYYKPDEHDYQCGVEI